MIIGLFTDGLLHLPLEDALDSAKGLGVEAVEIGTGNFSPAQHCQLSALLKSETARKEFMNRLTQRGLQLAALNCSGNPLHPNGEIARQAAEVTCQTLQLAGLLGVNRVVCMSGCPGTPEGGQCPNWVVATWPEEFVQLLEWQWRERVIPFWSEMADLAKRNGVDKLCFELHPGMCVYNLSSFLRLRSAVGATVAANLDPSHFFFQNIDPLAVIQALGEDIGFVHAKDARVDPYNLALHGALDVQPGKPVRSLVWAYRTLGYGHGTQFWSDFVSGLRSVGYDGVLSIEHEDPLMDSEEAIARAVTLLKGVILVKVPSLIPGAAPPY